MINHEFTQGDSFWGGSISLHLKMPWMMSSVIGSRMIQYSCNLRLFYDIGKMLKHMMKNGPYICLMTSRKKQ